jgi:Cysteine-rich CPCC
MSRLVDFYRGQGTALPTNGRSILSSRDTNVDRFPCPCCGYLTMREETRGTYEICPVCNWEDDGVQFADPSFWGGANIQSLNEARENFREFGAALREDLKKVRPPLPEEIHQDSSGQKKKP